MVVNAPGAMHNSTLMDMGGLYDKMEQWESSFDIQMVVDSSFQCIKCSFFIKSAQDHEPARKIDVSEYALFFQATSVFQMAEWGMRGFQASFPHIKDYTYMHTCMHR